MAKQTLTDDQLEQFIRDKVSLRQLRKSYKVGLYRYNRIRGLLAQKGVVPEWNMGQEFPDGVDFEKVTVQERFVDGAGDVVNVWKRGKVDPSRRLERIHEAARGLADQLPRAQPVPMPAHTAADELLNLHILTDYHLGMLADKAETGETWNLEVAEGLLMKWMAYAIDKAPPARVGLLGQLGDFLHHDFLPMTHKSGNLLDSAGRPVSILRVAMRCLRRILDMMLAKYPEVHVVISDANHDPHSGLFLREHLAALFENEPRLTVDTSAASYNCYEHGRVSLFFHHGDKAKKENVDRVFVKMFREVFGRTTYSFGHMGHLHSRGWESNLMLVEQHRTMAAPDHYATSSGYLSDRSAPVVTYHREFGEVDRSTATPAMVMQATSDGQDKAMSM